MGHSFLSWCPLIHNLNESLLPAGFFLSLPSVLNEVTLGVTTRKTKGSVRAGRRAWPPRGQLGAGTAAHDAALVRVQTVASCVFCYVSCSHRAVRLSRGVEGVTLLLQSLDISTSSWVYSGEGCIQLKFTYMIFVCLVFVFFSFS